MRVAIQNAGSALDLYEKEASGREHKQIDFVNAPLIRDELEVGPGVVRLLIRQSFADEVQRVLFPRVRGFGDCVPAREGQRHRRRGRTGSIRPLRL